MAATDTSPAALRALADTVEQGGMTVTDDGWIEWSGGPCPVSTKTKVQVRYRNGRENSHPRSAWVYRWGRGALSARDYDIVAYRIVKEG